MDPRRRCLLVLARMALKDGKVSEEERRAIEDTASDLGDDAIDEIVLDAMEQPFEALLAGVERYEDRFVIAMRAYLMAHADHDYDLGEQASFERLVESFGIEEEDRRLIERIEPGGSGAAAPRLLELHRGSSFYRGDF